MSAFRDLTGQRFGRLSAVEVADKSADGCYRWKCLCDCGNVVIVRSRGLITGNTKSCGCLNKEFEDFSGLRFGRLTVIRRVPEKKGAVYWECKCDCGNTTIVTSGNLKGHTTRSCGCLQSETARKARGIPHHKLTETLNAIKSRCNNPNHICYANYGGRGIKVCDEWNNGTEGHDRFVMWSLENGYSNGLSLDRIDNNKGYSPDNCRWTTRSVQSSNRRVRNSTGVLGVYRTRGHKKYCAMIGKDYKRINLGTFDTIEEAAKARRDAELQYYGFPIGDNNNAQNIDRNTND